jgi:hypothetical protein
VCVRHHWSDEQASPEASNIRQVLAPGLGFNKTVYQDQRPRINPSLLNCAWIHLKLLKEHLL